MIFRKIHPVILASILVVSFVALSACSSSEDRAEELYSIARLEEKQNNLEHATQLYYDLLLKYSNTSWGPKAHKRLEALKQYRGMRSREAAKHILSEINRAVEGGDWGNLNTFLLNPESFLWRTCGPGDDSKPEATITFEEAKGRFARLSKGSKVHVNETVHSEETQFGRFMTVETSGWNDEKWSHLYFIVSEVELEWKISGICYYSGREPNFKRFLESVEK